MTPALRVYAGALKFFVAAAQGANPGYSLLVLTYHRVLAEPDALLPDEPDAASFAVQMDLVGTLLNVLPLSEAVARLASGSLPPRAACITFDDGYVNNLEVAAPILSARRLPATVFVVSGVLGGRMWNDTVIEAIRCAPSELDLTDLGLQSFELIDFAARRSAVSAIIGAIKYLPPDVRKSLAETIAERCGAPQSVGSMLSEAGLRQLRGYGLEVGGHTVTHPILAQLDDLRAREEICGCKGDLEAIVGVPVTSFAYPNGQPRRDFDERHVDMVRRAGFSCAVTTSKGCTRRGTDLMQIPRFAPWNEEPARYATHVAMAYNGPPPASV